MMRRRRSGRHAGRRTRRRTGVATLLLFTLIGVPLLFYSGAVAADFVLLTMASNQVSSAADSAAIAGSLRQRTSSYVLDPAAARTVAADTFDEAVARGVTGLATITDVDVRVVGPRRVRVDVSYQVPNRAFTRWFTGADETLTLRREAEACNPGGWFGPTRGECARPRPD